MLAATCLLGSSFGQNGETRLFRWRKLQAHSQDNPVFDNQRLICTPGLAISDHAELVIAARQIEK